MAGTRAGGTKAAEANKLKYGENFYRRIGAMGGKAASGYSGKKGFAADRKRASWAGRLGGLKSRRGKKQ